MSDFTEILKALSIPVHVLYLCLMFITLDLGPLNNICHLLTELHNLFQTFCDGLSCLPFHYPICFTVQKLIIHPNMCMSMKINQKNAADAGNLKFKKSGSVGDT